MYDIDSVPTALQPVRSLLCRAEEVSKTHPLVAYQCILQAARSGMKLVNAARSGDVPCGKGGSTSAEVEAAEDFLNQLIDRLEDDKKRFASEEFPPAVLETMRDPKRNREFVQVFALSVFNKACDADASLFARKQTVEDSALDKQAYTRVARSFNAAAVYLDVLQEMYMQDPLVSAGAGGGPDAEALRDELEKIKERVKYSKFRTVKITQALRANASPPPPPEEHQHVSHQQSQQRLGGQSQVQLVADEAALERELDAMKVTPQSTNGNDAPNDSNQHPVNGSSEVDKLSGLKSPSPVDTPRETPHANKSPEPTAPTTTSTSVIANGIGRGIANDTDRKLNFTALSAVTKNAKYAISALQFYDTDTARKHLLEALRQLDIAEATN